MSYSRTCTLLELERLEELEERELLEDERELLDELRGLELLLILELLIELDDRADDVLEELLDELELDDCAKVSGITTSDSTPVTATVKKVDDFIRK